MWGFVLVAGSMAWAVLLGFFDVPAELPNANEFSVSALPDSGRIKGTVHRSGTEEEWDDDGVEWSSDSGCGRRKWVGNLLEGLTRAERAEALRLMRMERGEKLPTGTVCGWVTRVKRCLPVGRELHNCSNRLNRRLMAPVAWALPGSATLSVSVCEWSACVRAWYQPASQF